MEEPRELGEKIESMRVLHLFIAARLLGRGFTYRTPITGRILKISRVLCATFGGHWSLQISFCEKPKSAPINDVSNTRPARLDPTLPAALYPSLDRSRHIRHQSYSTRGPVPMCLYVRWVRVDRQSAPADLVGRIEDRYRGYTLGAP